MISLRSELQFSLLCLYICKLISVQLQYSTVHVLVSLETKACSCCTAEQNMSCGGERQPPVLQHPSLLLIQWDFVLPKPEQEKICFLLKLLHIGISTLMKHWGKRVYKRTPDDLQRRTGPRCFN